jgi:peptidoglycan hydrolase-like protein with peptidoglycan-binding domain
VTASWAVAASLDVLRAQLDARAPSRSRTSDGSIGDDAHAGRASDHNPWLHVNGQRLVTARDFTHDPAGGLDCHHLAAALVASRDERVKYLIWDRRILSGQGGPDRWTWRDYHGRNPHTRHLHLSVVADARCQDPRRWQLAWTLAGARPLLRRGDEGAAVTDLQRLLGITADGDFGPATDRAVRAFQKAHGLDVDGVVGPAPWGKLRAVAA